MLKKYSILIGIIIGVSLLIVATFYYPGGTSENLDSIGYDWANNYLSNLLSPLAVNGLYNNSRPFAISGILFLTASFGFFFVRFSRRIKIKSAAFVIKYFGILATVFGFLTVAPSLHDIMVTLSSILTLLIFFYITFLVIKTNLTVLKIVSVIFLLTFYLGAYMYFARAFLDYMPMMQKVIFGIKIVWILWLEYFTNAKDYQHINK
ncbi:MAG: hypothetical protein ACI86M_002280 [Saprospiraceae bacterium]|jgi:hypothetical protein